MIFLFDLTIARATSAQKEFGDILIWTRGAWRGADYRAQSLKADRNCFLVHHSDQNEFSEMMGHLEERFRKLPVIRFTGGDVSRRPIDEEWVRYRNITSDTPFQKDELAALDSWVKAGCISEDRPWLLLEASPVYLIGLLILLKLAREAGPSVRSSRRSRNMRVETARWWKDRLESETNWVDCISVEIGRRKLPSADNEFLEEFVTWVQTGSETSSHYDLFFTLADTDPRQNRLGRLISILERAVS